MEQQNEAELSNAASVVGRRISVCLKPDYDGESKEAIIVAYDPSTSMHTLRIKESEKEEQVALNKLQFTWVVPKPDSSAPKNSQEDQFALAVNRDAVGRELEIFSKKYDKYYKGKIVDFVEHANRHKIFFQEEKQTKLLDLEKHAWRFTDLVKGKKMKSGNKHNLLTSRFIGVQRVSAEIWKVATRFRENPSSIRRRTCAYLGSEKEAALVYDFFARKCNCATNFRQEKLTKEEVTELTKLHKKRPTKASNCKRGTSKYRGVHWQKNRNRWMARYSIRDKHTKHVNLGSFSDQRHAALAFDAEARKKGRADIDLNFPNEHPTQAQIASWRMNTTHYSMMGSGRKLTSQYRGVCRPDNRESYHIQINIDKVVEAYKLERGPVHAGYHHSEKHAGLLYDRICRRHGVPEKELNFPRNSKLSEVRLFDDECYFCHKEAPVKPLATPCNHVFCTSCVTSWFETKEPKCPSCARVVPSRDVMRPVTLIRGRIELENMGRTRKARGKSKQGAKKSTAAALYDADDESCGGSTTSIKDKGRKINHEVDDGMLLDRKISESEAVKDPVSSETKILEPPYPIGTEFLKDFPGAGRFQGTIVSFDGAHYTVTYEDGDKEQLSEYEFTGSDVELCTSHREAHTGKRRSSGRKRMASQNKLEENTTPGLQPRFPVGTQFTKEFVDGEFKGTIESCNGRHYSVRFEDGDEEQLSEYEFDGSDIKVLPMQTTAGAPEKITTSSQQSHGRNKLSPPTPRFAVGTKFTKGVVVSCNGSHYSVQYEDGDEEQLSEHEFDGSDIEMVKSDSAGSSDDEHEFNGSTIQAEKSNSAGGNAHERVVERDYLALQKKKDDKKACAPSPRYPVGTLFKKEFVDGWFKGTVLSCNGNHYSVQYEDGDEEQLSEYEFGDSDIEVLPLHLEVARNVEHVVVTDGMLPKKRKQTDPTPRYSVGTRIAKDFAVGRFEGVIASFDGKRYLVKYEDGDKEQLSEDEFAGSDLEVLPSSNKSIGPTDSSNVPEGGAPNAALATRGVEQVVD